MKRISNFTKPRPESAEPAAAARRAAGAYLAIGLATIIGLASCKSASDGPGAESQGSDAESILTGLGITVNNPPAASLRTTQGTTVAIDPESWMPTRTREVVLMPRDEVMAFGPSVGSGRASYYEDGYSSGYAYSALWASDSSWASGKNLACGGDFDGDAIEEALILTYAAATGWQLRVYDGGALSQIIPVGGIPASYASYAGAISSHRWETSAFMVPCQVESDDAMEFGVALGDTAWLFDVSSSGGTWAVSQIDTASYSYGVYGFAAGDCDGDGLDEICVIVGNGAVAAQYSLCDSRLSSNTLLAFTSLTYEYAHCCFGDPDGDRIEELVISRLASISALAGYTIYISAYDWGGSSFAQIYGPTQSAAGESAGGFIPLCLDMNGDGYDEIFCMQDLFIHSPISGSWSKVHTDTTDACVIPAPFQAADVDGDGKEDLVFCYGNGSYTCVAYSLDSAGTGLTQKKAYYSGVSSPYVPAVVALNADDDSPRVAYDHHELKYSNPIVIGVMAASPYYSEVASSGATPYDMHEWTTYIGKSSSTTTTQSAKVGFSVGGGVKGETKVSIFGYDALKLEWEVTNSESFTWEYDYTSTIETDVQYTAPGAQDTVLFTAVPIDEYFYEVVSSPIASEVGQNVIVSIPRAYTPTMVSVNFYNAHNGFLDDVVLPHALGDPWSYPNSAERASILAAADTAGLKYYTNSNTGATGRAEGSYGPVTNLSIAVSEGNGSSFSWDSTTSMEAAVGTEAVEAIALAGFSVGYSTTTETTTGTSFGGTIGYLPSAYYDKGTYYYTGQIFAYQAINSLQNKYWIVEYSVN
jgi:hypothetical protein